jgi:hypothetical protein
MNEVWHARSGIGARGRVRPRTGRTWLPVRGSAWKRCPACPHRKIVMGAAGRFRGSLSGLGTVWGRGSADLRRVCPARRVGCSADALIMVACARLAVRSAVCRCGAACAGGGAGSREQRAARGGRGGRQGRAGHSSCQQRRAGRAPAGSSRSAGQRRARPDRRGRCRRDGGRTAYPARARRVPGHRQGCPLHPGREKEPAPLYARLKSLPWRHVPVADSQRPRARPTGAPHAPGRHRNRRAGLPARRPGHPRHPQDQAPGRRETADHHRLRHHQPHHHPGHRRPARRMDPRALADRGPAPHPFATSPMPRTPPRSEPAVARRSRSPCATSQSQYSSSPGIPASQPPAATTAEMPPGPWPPWDLGPHDRNGRHATMPRPCSAVGSHARRGPPPHRDGLRVTADFLSDSKKIRCLP